MPKPVNATRSNPTPPLPAEQPPEVGGLADASDRLTFAANKLRVLELAFGSHGNDSQLDQQDWSGLGLLVEDVEAAIRESVREIDLVREARKIGVVQ